MRVRIFAFMAVLLLSVAATGSASAASYYVALSGNDANPGTLSAPFRTINKAAGVAAPGDVVNVRGGVYNGQVSIGSKGTSSARITFRSYPGELAVIDGTGTGTDKNLVTFYKASFVDFAGFEVRNATRVGILGWNASNIRVLNNDVHHSWRNGIYFGGDSGVALTDIVIDGNDVHHNVLENQYGAFPNGGWATGISLNAVERGTVVNNEVHNNWGEGLGTVLSNHLTIRGNKSYDNFSVNIYLDNSRYVTIDRNLVYSTGDTAMYRDGYPASGIGLANEYWSTQNYNSDITVTNNVVIDGKWGFYYLDYEAGGGLRNTTVANNTFYKARVAMIEVSTETHANSVVQNNIFYTAGGAVAARVGGTGVTYRHNLWYGGNAGAAAGVGDVIGNPLFVNLNGLTAADFKVQPLSPAIHAGYDATPAVTDHFGSQRTASFDIGAHELSLPLGSSAPVASGPAAPANLAGSLSGTTVSLQWTASATGAAGYRVYRNNTEAANVSGTTWRDENRAAGTTYTYSVVAYDAIGNVSPSSNSISVTTESAPSRDTERPTNPARLRASAQTTTSISLAWNAATDNVGVAGYKLYQNGNYVTTIKGTRTKVSGLAAGKTYSFHVTAIDAAGNVSGASNILSASTAKSSRRRSAKS